MDDALEVEDKLPAFRINLELGKSPKVLVQVLGLPLTFLKRLSRKYSKKLIHVTDFEKI